MVRQPTQVDFDPLAEDEDGVDGEDLDCFILGSSFIVIILCTLINLALCWLMATAAIRLSASIPRLHDWITRGYDYGLDVHSPGVNIAIIVVSFCIVLGTWRPIGKRLDYMIWYAKER